MTLFKESRLKILDTYCV